MAETIIIGILIFAPIARGAVRIWAFGPIQICIVFALFLWLYQMAKNKVLRFKKTILDVPITIFLMLSLVSLFYSKYLHDSLLGLFMWMSSFALYYLTVNCIDTEKKIARLIGIIIAIGFFLSIFGILQYFGGLEKSWWSNTKVLSSTYVNHNHFAGILELVIPISVAILFTGSVRGGLKIILWYALLIMLIAFILTMSRGGWVSLYLSLGVMLFLLWKKKILRKETLIIFLLISASFIFFVAWSGLANEVLNRAATYKELDFNGRLEIWQATLSMIKEYPFTGVGIGSFIHRVPKYRPEGLNMLINFAHNDFLQITSELGVFGLFALCLILFLVIARGIKVFFISHTPIKKALGLGIGISTLSIAIHSLVDFNLHIPANAILFFILTGLIMNIRSRKESEPVFIKISLGKWSRVLIVSLMTVAFVSLEIFITRNLFAEIFIGKGERFLSKGDFYNANLSYQTSIALAPRNSKYYLKSGELYFKKALLNELGEDIWFEESKEPFKKALEFNPFNGLAWLGLSDLYRTGNKLTLAQYAIEKALKIDPNNSFYLKKLGAIALESGDIEEAFELFVKVREIEKKSSLSECPSKVLDRDFYLKEAKLKLASGQTIQALNLFKIAEKILPSDETKLDEFICYFKLGELNVAIKKFRELAPNLIYKGIFLAQLCEFHLLRNHLDLAGPLSEKAYRLVPEDPMVLSVRFKVFKALNKKTESKRMLEKILCLNKNAQFNYSENPFELDINLDWKLFSEWSRERYFILAPGLYEIEIIAHGEMAKGEGPRMKVSLNSNPLLSLNLSNESPRGFTKKVAILNPENLIKIEFKNDFYDPVTGEDRNLIVDKVIFRYLNEN